MERIRRTHIAPITDWLPHGSMKSLAELPRLRNEQAQSSQPDDIDPPVRTRRSRIHHSSSGHSPESRFLHAYIDAIFP